MAQDRAAGAAGVFSGTSPVGEVKYWHIVPITLETERIGVCLEMKPKILMMVLALFAVFAAVPAMASAGCGVDCCCVSCCPPPVQKVLCVTDPCTGCTKQVCVCVPACCTEEPCVTCRRGFLGRTVLTYTWNCCCHSVDVVITRRGDVRVRG
jgi:hypothetical protein